MVIQQETVKNREDVQDLGGIMNMESVEQEFSQSAVTVEELIMWLTVVVRL